jgi:hypothetical protein
MRSALLALSAIAALAAPAAAPAERLSGEAELDRMTKGLVAGDPVSCIDTRRFNSTRIVDGTAIVYEGGGMLYVNVPRGGGRGLDRWDVLVTRQFSTSLCRGEVVHLLDSSTMMQTGAIFLGDFVPYRRAATR